MNDGERGSRIAGSRQGQGAVDRWARAVDYIDGDALPLGQARDTGAFQHRSVHNNILAAPIRADKPKPLCGIEPFDRAGFLDGGSAARLIQG
jgi:hypothetical protein